MPDLPDFEFGFGKGRHLRGRGWRGLVALALLLSAAVLTLSSGRLLIEPTFRLLRPDQ